MDRHATDADGRAGPIGIRLNGPQVKKQGYPNRHLDSGRQRQFQSLQQEFEPAPQGDPADRDPRGRRNPTPLRR